MIANNTPISVCILINQWRPVIIKTLASYHTYCGEILLGVNGNFQPENHPELAQFSKLKIINLVWEGYGQTKNNLANNAKNNWILSVDTDEVADAILQQSLANFNPKKENYIYALAMCHHLAGCPVRHGAWSTGKRDFLRLYHRQFTQWNEAEVHESIQRPADAQIIRLSGQINHFTADSYEQFINKNRHYAQLSANKYREKGKIAFFGKSRLSAGFNFIKDYIFRLGFLDGKAGWQVAKGNALYTYWKYHFLRKN